MHACCLVGEVQRVRIRAKGYQDDEMKWRRSGRIIIITKRVDRGSRKKKKEEKFSHVFLFIMWYSIGKK